MSVEIQTISRGTAEEIQSMFKDRNGDVSMSLRNVRLDSRKGDMWMTVDTGFDTHILDIISMRWMTNMGLILVAEGGASTTMLIGE